MVRQDMEQLQETGNFLLEMLKNTIVPLHIIKDRSSR